MDTQCIRLFILVFSLVTFNFTEGNCNPIPRYPYIDATWESDGLLHVHHCSGNPKASLRMQPPESIWSYDMGSYGAEGTIVLSDYGDILHQATPEGKLILSTALYEIGVLTIPSKHTLYLTTIQGAIP